MLPAVHLVVSGLVGVVVVIMQLSIHRIDEGHVSLPPQFSPTRTSFQTEETWRVKNSESLGVERDDASSCCMADQIWDNLFGAC